MIRGDFKELAGYRDKLARLKTATRDTARGAVVALQAAVDATAAAGADAYGSAHAPKLDGGQAFASVTGKLAKVRARGTEIVASVTRKIPRYMNRGRASGAKGGFMPPRPIIPNDGDPIPPAWTEAIERSAERVFDTKAAT